VATQSSSVKAMTGARAARQPVARARRPGRSVPPDHLQLQLTAFELTPEHDRRVVGRPVVDDDHLEVVAAESLLAE
jgi:hypothetical protein